MHASNYGMIQIGGANLSHFAIVHSTSDVSVPLSGRLENPPKKHGAHAGRTGILVFWQHDKQRKASRTPFVCRHPIEMKACSHDRNTEIFPLWVTRTVFGKTHGVGSWEGANISPIFTKKLEAALGMQPGDCRNTLDPVNVLHYVLALTHSPQYRIRYADQLKRSYPRVFFPRSRQLFKPTSKIRR